MGSLITGERGETGDRRGTDGWYVDGVRHAGTAAKFWLALIEEAVSDFPPGTALELRADTPGELDEGLLYPRDALVQDLLSLSGSDLRRAMRETMAVLELTGPPGAVHLRMLSGEECLFERDMGLETLDAGILPYLVAWLLEWSHVPVFLWNEEQVADCFEAEDRAMRLRYHVAFRLHSRHLSEGLYRRALRLQAGVGGRGIAPAAGRRPRGESA